MSAFGVLGALGLAVLAVAPARAARCSGLAAWGIGVGGLAASLAPAGHATVLAVAAVCGAALAAGLAVLFVRVPWALAPALLACAPARLPVSLGATKANLLVVLYVVVAGAALALGWELVRGERRARELGPLTWPVALLVAWTGVSLLWSGDPRQGRIVLLFFVLPFGLLAVALARLRWHAGWMKALYVQLAALALVFALIGGVQYLTRDVFWNPKVIVANAYAPSSWLYRVNSVFYDPSMYGRFLVVAIVASIVVVLWRGGRASWAAAGVALVTWVGLVPSFSQTSFVALAVAAVAAVALRWRNALALVGVVAILAAAAVAARDHGVGGRSRLVSEGARIALAHPAGGVGVGGFTHAYAKRVHLRGAHPRVASHSAPVTVAVETGLPGLALLAWLLVAALAAPLRSRAPARIGIGLALLAIVVHSLGYASLFEDPLFWALAALGVTSVAPPPLHSPRGATRPDAALRRSPRRDSARLRRERALQARAEPDPAA